MGKPVDIMLSDPSDKINSQLIILGYMLDGAKGEGSAAAVAAILTTTIRIRRASRQRPIRRILQ